MVDSERRRRILKTGVGVGAGVTVLGGGGKLLLDYVERVERNDNEFEEATRAERAEDAIQDYDWRGMELSAPAIAPGQADVHLEQHGTTDGGGARYRATVDVPVSDPYIDVCRHDGDPEDEWLLGQKLYEDAIRVFDASMKILGPLHPANRDPAEDRIDRFIHRFEDDGGSMVVPFTPEDAYYAAGDSSPQNIDPLDTYTRTRFREVYRQNLRVTCSTPR